MYVVANQKQALRQTLCFVNATHIICDDLCAFD